MQLKLNNQLLDLSQPIVMGIINATPDSFFAGNRHVTDKSILHTAEKMLDAGATILDIGGYSTRSQADDITPYEEIRRLSSATEAILKRFPDVFLSVDTFRASVARHMVEEYRVAMINDIGGGTLDHLMFETIASLDVAYVLMHTRGMPQVMQTKTQYEDVVAEVMHVLAKRLAQLRLLGVNDVVVDPGFGFAKTMEQNYELLRKLPFFAELEVPVLAGMSRKSMLYKLLDTDADHALNATTAANMLALVGGASLLRVHDVKEAVEAVKIFCQYRNE